MAVPAVRFPLVEGLRIGFIRLMSRRCLAILLIGFAGCVLPAGPQSQISGRRVSKNECAFLGEPNVTRAEVIATLGAPSWSLPLESVILYCWTREREWNSQVGIYGPHGGGHLGKITWGKTVRNTGLFIQFDSHERVRRHEIWIYPQNTDAENACRLWLARSNQIPNLPGSGY